MSFWDRPNVVENLQVLSSIVAYRVPSEERSPAAVRGYQTLGKLFSGAAKLFELDAAARAEIPGLLESAERGVLNIRRTYESAGVIGTAQTFDDLKKVIDRVRREVGPPSPGQGPAGSRLGDTYAQYLMLRLQQGRYTSRGSAGVCQGFCLDWISRKMHPARSKGSYAVSKHPDQESGSEQPPRACAPT